MDIPRGGMPALRVLITNHELAVRAGSQLYARDLAFGLLSRGHFPIVYSPVLGDVAHEIRKAGIPVIDNLNTVTVQPDIIHGQHHIETMTALLHFSHVPALFVCHGWIPWQEAAPHHPRIRRYVAVSGLCLERLVAEHAVPQERTRLLLNFVDLERFRPRSPLPPAPRKALLFSNFYSQDAEQVAVIRQACGQAGIDLGVLGAGVGNTTTAPEALLRGHDIVFATGRSAHEALAVGCAVVVCCGSRVGPLVTTKNVDELRRENFGLRTTRSRINSETISREIARYDACDAAETCRQIRAICSHDTAVNEYLALYREVIAEEAAEPSSSLTEGKAAAAYVCRLGRLASRCHELEHEAQVRQSKKDTWAAFPASRTSRMHRLAAKLRGLLSRAS